MRPLTELSKAEARGLQGLLFDLDDTLLDHGQLTLDAYQALCNLAETDLWLVAVTGRPASWGELVAGMWPIRAALSENGHLAHARLGGRVQRLDAIPSATRTERRERLLELTEQLMAEFSDLVPADDVHGRVSDFTFDIGEFRKVDPDVVAAARRSAEARGASTTVSSVHFHITFDTHDKASGSVAFLSQHGGIDTTRALERFAYVGDSENDAACFAAFRTTIGVANLSGAPTVTPRYRCGATRGAGFAELAAHLLRLRS
ncbi:MAG: HAD-IIB family hydrolase [Polyangiaceae bacterium]|nr:HAD-IIB family hydrolase [Polyangiaceae bacterium]